MKKLIRPAVLLLALLFMYAPILILALYSFTSATQIGAIRGFSLHNYVTLFTTEELRNMIIGTVLLALAAAVIATILGTLGAVGAFYSKKRTASAISAMNQIPVINADVVTGFSICILLVVVFGISKDTYIPLLIGHVTLCAPFVYLSVIPKLKQMDPSLYEAALDLGATPVAALWKVVFPQIYSGIAAGFALAITLSLDDYFIATYTKPAVFDTISTYVVNATKGAQTDIKTALWALSTVIFVLVVLIVLGMNIRANREAARRSGIAKPKRRGRKGKAAAGTAAVLALVFTLGSMAAAPAPVYADDNVTVIRVANWEEYIDLGDWDDDELIELESGDVFGERSMIDDFEDWYYETYGRKVKVEYSTFGTNEDLYNMLTLGDHYDLICPSEYLIMKLMKEDKVQPLSDAFFDTADENNFYIRGVSPYIKEIFDSHEAGGMTWSDCIAGYMWGVTGFVYNPAVVSREEASTWHLLENSDYRKQITVKDSVRETYFAAVGALKSDLLTSEEFRNDPNYPQRLQEEMNDVSPETVAAVQHYLQGIKDNIYSFETDAGKADMITGKVVVNYQWSGDGSYTLDQADEDGLELAWAVPEESTNIYFDGWIMLKDGIAGDLNKQHASEAFINYVSRPDNVVRNMYYVGYTSVISGGDDNRIFEYVEYLDGAEDDETDTVDYPLGYFFSGDPDDPDYIVTVPADQVDRQISARYPSEEQIRRASIMTDFNAEDSERINQMWIRVRCYNIHNVPVWVWPLGIAALAGILVWVIRRRRRERSWQ